MLLVLAKGSLKLRMKRRDLYKPIECLTTNLDWMERRNNKWVKDFFVNNKFNDGTTYVDKWRSDIGDCISLIEKEPTWLFQRKRLLALCISLNSWIATHNAVSPRYKYEVHLWKNLISHREEFQISGEDIWYQVLYRRMVFSVASFSTLTIIGMSCYGINESYFENVDVYRKLKAHIDQGRVEFHKNMLNLIKENPEMAADVFLDFKQDAGAYWEEQDNLLKALVEDITSMNPIIQYGQRWENLTIRYNGALKELMQRYESH